MSHASRNHVRLDSEGSHFNVYSKCQQKVIWVEIQYPKLGLTGKDGTLFLSKYILLTFLIFIFFQFCKEEEKRTFGLFAKWRRGRKGNYILAQSKTEAQPDVKLADKRIAMTQPYLLYLFDYL